MDEETRALRADIVQTRAQLSESVQELSARVTPRQQAQKLLLERRDVAVERLSNLSADDVGEAAAGVRRSIQQHPRAAMAAAAAALLVVRRRRRR